MVASTETDDNGVLSQGGGSDARLRTSGPPRVGVCRWTAAALLGLCLASPASVAALGPSVVVLTPPAVEAGAAAEDAEFALDVIASRLRGDDYNVVSHGQAASAMAALAEEGEGTASDPHTCTSLECAAQFRAFFDAEVALHLSLTAGRVAVTLVESEQAQWTGSAALREGELEGDTLHALSVARRRRAERRGPWLTVEGTPHGAEVRVDGRLVGTLPFDGRFAPGEHEVDVRSDLREPVRQTVRLPVSSWAERRVAVALETSEPALAVPPPHVEQDVSVADAAKGPERQGTPVYDYVVGALMVAGGAALAVGIPSATAVRAGTCSNGSSDLASCPEVYELDGAVWGQMAAGLALIGGGVTVMTMRPIQLMLGADRSHAVVGVRGAF